MSLTTLDSRALAVILISKGQIETMHLRERKRLDEYGHYLPYEIAALSGIGDISERHGVTAMGRAVWADHVGAELRKMFTHVSRHDGDDLDFLHAFDWAVSKLRPDLSQTAALKRHRAMTAQEF